MVRFSDIFKKKQDKKDKNQGDIPDLTRPVIPEKIQTVQKTSESPELPPVKINPVPPPGVIKFQTGRDDAGAAKTPLPLFFKKIKIDKPVSPSVDQEKREKISFTSALPGGRSVSSPGGPLSNDDNLQSPRTDFRPSQSGREREQLNNLSLAEAVKIKEGDNLQKSGELYRQLIYLAEEVLANVENGRFPDTLMMARIIEAVKEVVNLMIIKERSLLDLTYDYPSIDKTGAVSKNYIFFHLANVCILSLEIGRELGHNKSRLQALGVAALLHDKRMYSFPDTTVTENFPDIAEILREVAHSHFDDELSGGAGYPEAKNQAVEEYVQLLTLVDFFETMTHPRLERKKKSVQQAIRELLEISASPFTKNALKILIKQIGLYPVGSWVELNTGEIARVVKVNAKLPLRPVVHIFFDAQRKKMPAPKIFNLADNQNVYIKNTVDETELEL